MTTTTPVAEDPAPTPRPAPDHQSPAPGRPAPPWARWRSPAGDPRYARPAALAVAAVAGLLYCWGIDRSGYHLFYADAVRSMSQSWRAFLFGSYDPASTITLDKLPGFLWPQALSARLLGFHPWALTLPQAIEGVLAVLVLYRAVRRWAGARAGLLAAAAFALTPVVAGLFRTSVEDPLFTLLLLLAADATQRALPTARLRSLLLAGLWVGLAFQAKMLEAWAVLPVLGAVYLVAAPAPLRRRLGQLALAGLVTVAVSASWMVAVSLTPARDRPYIDGTTDDSAYSMVVGYNFLNRFPSVGLSAADTGSVPLRGAGVPAAAPAVPVAPGAPAAPAASAPAAGATAATATTAGAPSWQGGGAHGDGGWGKLLGHQFAPQTGWLYPLAAISALCALAWRRREPRTDRLRAGYLLWGGWLAVFFLVLSAGSIGAHTYYLGVIAAPLAALSGAGTALLWQAFTAGGRRAWALPGAVAATVLWGGHLARSAPGFLPWLAPATLLLGAVALALLAAARLTADRAARRAGADPTAVGDPTGPAGGRLATVGLLATLLAVLLAPGAWAASVLNPAYGSSGMGTVGPAGPLGPWSAAAPGAAVTGAGAARSGRTPADTLGRANPGGPGHPSVTVGDARLTRDQQALLDYVRAHGNGARYLFATTDWQSSSPYILATGEEVLPMGGFTGRAPAPSLDRVRTLVATGELRYVLVAAPSPRTPEGPEAVTAWVRASCTPVPADAYAARPATAPATTPTASPATEPAPVLYHCAP
ncbi:glycosyltransferase family 39 protein [Kitasatospora nipponensis]|uniref:Glycosyltransferase family 39 protein n=1 Tax=Kitasatospora nipponensis TaxID=258049 RepID=A0ABN1WW17_9ACTN